MGKGTVVKEAGLCRCGERDKGYGMFRDVRDCYHRPSSVRHEFIDGSYWVINSMGYGRRFTEQALIS